MSAGSPILQTQRKEYKIHAMGPYIVNVVIRLYAYNITTTVAISSTCPLFSATPSPNCLLLLQIDWVKVRCMNLLVMCWVMRCSCGAFRVSVLEQATNYFPLFPLALASHPSILP